MEINSKSDVMKVNLGQAVKMFFSNSSLEMVYFEAIANALDAEATDIKIIIRVAALSEPNTLKIEISDNGVGFTDERYKKFSNLFDVDETSHKGLGRLVYLCYFNEVNVTSYYRGTKKRMFKFSEDFKEEKFEEENTPKCPSGTTFQMSGYTYQKIAKNDFIIPSKLKYRILEEFYARLFILKKEDITISIQSFIGSTHEEATIKSSDIPEFKNEKLPLKLDLFTGFDLYYSIKKVESNSPYFIAAITVDQRTVKVNLISDENLPPNYEMVFLLYSDYFQGKIDASRQNLSISSPDYKKIQSSFRKKVSSILETEIPEIKSKISEVKEELLNQYPHLNGYIDSEDIGYISKNDILKKAQEHFCKDQKELLEATSLNDEQYERSLKISSKALTEYILFRQFTIDRLRSIKKEDLESKIHNIIAPQKMIFRDNSRIETIYQNCSWILDEKFMTYTAVLSEREMSELIAEITKSEVEKDDGRPDIAIIFSDNPNKSKKVEVVIVELKRKGLKPEENVKVEVQLEKRARKLFDIFPDKIQRLWLYGVAELDNEYKSHLSTAGYHPLYSKGTVFVNTADITVNWDTGIKIPAVRYVMDFDALINDANARNQTFLDLIKSKFKE